MTSDAVGVEKSGKSGQLLSPEQAAAAAMVAEARQRGLTLTGPDGLLKLFTKIVLETLLNGGMIGHVGHKEKLRRSRPSTTSAMARGGRQ